MNIEVISEVFGYSAFVLSVIALLMSTDFKFKIVQIVASFFFFAHFIIEDAFMGAISMAIGVVSLAISLFYDNKKILYFFFSLYIGLFLYNVFAFDMAKWYEIIPAISNLLWFNAMVMSKGQSTNYKLLPVVTCWIIYSIAITSMSSLLTQAVVLGFLLFRIFNFNKQEIKNSLSK